MHSFLPAGCLGGWGFKDCATQCGGGTGSNATYGPPGRDYGSPCISCNDVLTSYSYNWQTDNDVWSAPVTARLEADNAVDCLAEFTQVVDGAFYVPAISLASNLYANNVTSFSDCVATCGDGCALVTYDYKTLECWALYLTPSTYEGCVCIAWCLLTAQPVAGSCGALALNPALAVSNLCDQSRPGLTCCLSAPACPCPPLNAHRDPYIAFKNFQAGSTQASSVEALNSSSAVSAKSGGTNDFGTYSWHQTPDAPLIGIQKAAPGREYFLFYQDCMTACDYDRECIGVVIEQRLPDPAFPYNVAGPQSCMLVYGNTRPGTNKRTVLHTVISSVEIPQWTAGEHQIVCCGVPYI